LNIEWRYKSNYLSKEGDKSVYPCSLNKICKSEVRLLYNNEDETVGLYTNNIEHDHSVTDECDWGIPKETKNEIFRLYTSGLTKPRLIQYELRKLNLEEPTDMQLANWIRYHKQKSIGKTHLTFADLETWCIKRLHHL
jgi:hypothetical protein